LTSFTKVLSRKTEKELNYTTSEDAIEELRILARQKGWAIFEALKVLKEGKADSFSFTQDKPYSYFYGRITGETIIIRLKTSERETEFRLPIESLV
jgi:hypothetical protein